MSDWVIPSWHPKIESVAAPSYAVNRSYAVEVRRAMPQTPRATPPAMPANTPSAIVARQCRRSNERARMPSAEFSIGSIPTT